MRAGTEIEDRPRLHAPPARGLTQIELGEPGRRFDDRQVSGSYSVWHHTHEFNPHAEGTERRDLVRYALPLGALGRVAGGASCEGTGALRLRRDTISAACAGGRLGAVVEGDGSSPSCSSSSIRPRYRRRA